MNRKQSIGIFDSGLGGLTVMREIHKLLPHENLIYFGDTARLPYGNKSPETLLRYSKENTEFLIQHEIKLLIVACNTSCAAALDVLRSTFSIPIIGITEQGADALSQSSSMDQIAVLATQSTISSNVYLQKILKKKPSAQVHQIACPLFVPLIEEGFAEHPLMHLCVQEYLRPLKDLHLNAILLGCSHYPLIQSTLEKELSSSTLIIDPAVACAKKAQAFLSSEGLLNTQIQPPSYQFYVSQDPLKFNLLGKTFFNYPIKAELRSPL